MSRKNTFSALASLILFSLLFVGTASAGDNVLYEDYPPGKNTDCSLGYLSADDPNSETDHATRYCSCDEDCMKEQGYIIKNYYSGADLLQHLEKKLYYYEEGDNNPNDKNNGVGPGELNTNPATSDCSFGTDQGYCYAYRAPESPVDLKSFSGSEGPEEDYLVPLNKRIHFIEGPISRMGEVYAGYVYVTPAERKITIRTENLLLNSDDNDCYEGLDTPANREWKKFKDNGDAWPDGYIAYSIYQFDGSPLPDGDDGDEVSDGERAAYVSICRNGGDGVRNFRGDSWTIPVEPGIYPLYVAAAYESGEKLAQDFVYTITVDNHVFKTDDEAIIDEDTYTAFGGELDAEGNKFYCEHYIGEYAWLDETEYEGSYDNRCCGNNEDTDAMAAVEGAYCEYDIEQGWRWVIDSTPANYCGSVGGDYEQFTGTQPTIDQIRNSIDDGSDWCCGDDSGYSCQQNRASCADFSVEECSSVQGCDTATVMAKDQGLYLCQLSTSEQWSYCVDLTVEDPLVKIACEDEALMAGCVSVENDGFSLCQPPEDLECGTTTTCTGEFSEPSCASFTDKDTCPENYCSWSFDPDEALDYAYLQPEGGAQNQYLCLNDYDNDKGTISNSEADWHWWWAQQAAEQRLIHTVEQDDRITDYISNGESWYRCDVEVSRNDNDHFLSAFETMPVTESENIDYCDGVRPYLRHLQPITSETLEGAGIKSPFYSFAIMGSGACSQDPLDPSSVDELYTAYVEEYLDGQELDEDTKALVVEELISQFKGCCRAADNENHYELEPLSKSCDPTTVYCRYEEGEEPDTFQEYPMGPTSGYFDVEEYQQGDQAPPLPQAESCDDLAQSLQAPVDTCSQNEVCVPYEGQSTTVDIDGETCCVRGSCQQEQESTCRELGGQLLSEGYEEYFMCTQEPVLTSNGECCLGRVDVRPESTDELSAANPSSEAYVCYEGPAGSSLIAECCYNDNCDNIGSKAGVAGDNGRIFTQGSQLNTIQSFDDVLTDDQGITALRNRGMNFTTFSQTPLGGIRLSSLINIQGLAREYDWGEYEALTFDVRYQGDITLRSLIIDGDADSGNGRLAAIPLADKSFVPADNDGALRKNMWHHITIPLTTELKQKLTSGVRSLYFAVEGTGQGEILTDNYVLQRGENRYCAGPYRIWLEDLVADEDRDGDGAIIDSQGRADLDDVGPEMIACNNQLSYSWTGTKCCGAQTEKPTTTNTSNPSYYEKGEYYTDTDAACWGGVNVQEGRTVADSYGGYTDAWPHLLYARADGEGEAAFWSCNTTMPDFTDVYGNQYSTNQTPPEGWTRIRNVQPFSIIGERYCDPAGTWLPADRLRSVKVLATKLYEMAGDDFSLHCDDYSIIAEESLNSTSLLSTLSQSDNPATACVLRNGSGDGQSVTTGIPLSRGGGAQEANAFIAALYKRYEPLNSSAQSPPDCSQYQEGDLIYDMPTSTGLEGDGTDFFLECDGSGEPLRVRYNQPLNLLLLSIDQEPTGGFLLNTWKAVSGFFKKMFSEEPQSTSATEFPLRLEYQSDFSHLYLARTGDSSITGIMELDRQGEPTWWVRIDYDQLQESVRPLLEGYYAQGLPERNGRACGSGPNQTIFITLPEDNPYARSFDWRYLTSNLRLQDLDGESSFTSDDSCWLHNGRLDAGEECDDLLPGSPNEIVVPASYQGEGCEQCVEGAIDKTNCGEWDYVLFATTTKTTGDFGGFGEADSICQQEAAQAGYPRSTGAKAVLSTSQMSARQRFQDHLDETVLTPEGRNISTLRDMMDSYSDTEAFVFPLEGNFIDDGDIRAAFWTGSDRVGHTMSQTCQDWQNIRDEDAKTLYGAIGGPSNTQAGNWLLDSAVSCASQARLLCLVPESEDYCVLDREGEDYQACLSTQSTDECLATLAKECRQTNTEECENSTSYCVVQQEPLTICGDGVREGAEGCDDGNVEDGDGCDHQCQPRPA